MSFLLAALLAPFATPAASAAVPSAATTAPAPAFPVVRPAAPDQFVLDEERGDYPRSADRDISYTFVEFSYLSTELDGSGPGAPDDPTGFEVVASARINDTFYVTTSGSSQEADVGAVELDLDTLGVRLGLREELEPGLDLILELGWGWVQAETNLPPSDVSDDGLVARAGARFRPNRTWEMRGSVDYEDVGAEDDVLFTGQVLAHVSASAALVGSYTVGDEADTWALGLRFSF